MPRPPRFTIRAASALTGINQNTLRAWERRHGLIQPERTPKGYRLYSDHDIERLRLIQRAMQEGVSIGRVRSYLESDGAAHDGTNGNGPGPTIVRDGRLVEFSLAGAGLNGTTTIQVPEELPARPADPPLAWFAEQIEAAARRLDRQALERTFGRAVGLYSLRQAFHHALAPALTRMGRLHLDDTGDAESRDLLTSFAREKLLAALAGLRPLHQQPRALFACLSGEPQEITLMLLSLEIGLEGVSAQYLGAGASVEAIVQAAQAANSRAVALSAGQAVPRERLLELRDRLAELPRRPRLMLAGPASIEHRGWLGANGIEALAHEPESARAQILRVIG
jgi:DNA-binding transcriptional MerR regulator